MITPTTWPHKVADPKDPESTLDYVIPWRGSVPGDSDWLVEGESIVGSTWEMLGDAIIVAHSFTADAATVWVSGGTTTFRITNTITTDSLPVARTDSRTLVIKVKDR